MKKWLTALLMTLLMVLAAQTAFAIEAADITDECKFKTTSSKYKYTQMTDNKYTTYWKANKAKNPSIQVTSPDKDTLIGGIYACFGNLPESWEVQVSTDAKKWETVAQGPQYYHAYVPLPEPARYVRLQVTTGKQYELYLNEFFVLGVGDKPDWVQDWQPTPEKADIMFISTHPDDELIFFGGAIPTYATEMKRDVVVAYYTRSNPTRSSELLNGLWYMGVRTYPVIGNASDKMYKQMNKSYEYAGSGNLNRGKKNVNEWFVELYRKYKPEVVVTHDIDGEYGHSMHMMVSDAALNAIAIAANEDEYTDSTVAYGTWEVKKLYRHLWKENQIKLDWSVPLNSMGGATSLELADSAFELFHKTQETSGQSVLTTGAEYDNELFGLVYTTVGEDVNKNDFLENIDLSGKPVVEEVVEELPYYYDMLPELNERGFLDGEEFIYSSEEEGLWIFIDETSKIIIERKFDATQPLTWFECDIYTDIEQGEMLRTIWNDDVKRTKVRVDAAETAKKHNVVFATNTDYFTYRVDVNASGRATGVVIRNGELLYDDPFPEKKAMNPAYMPNLDMVAFMKDGSLEVYRSHEITAKELLEKDAYDVYSFGPYLMKDGKLSQQAYEANETKNPRCALGMVEPGHYVYIMVEGRMEKTRSQGITMKELAKLMRAKGCENAINLDGGQTAVLIFMGKQLNKIGSYDGGKTNSRPTCEVMGVGYSEQVGTYEVR
ncbi:MAG: phosphodiester glycosidase family protein [Clostridia bacterium]|nr:phosphodiester glycosidase family protein [Clostridia bacterium]